MQSKIQRISQPNLESIDSELYKCFYQFFYFYEENPQHADLFAKKMEQLFCEIGTHKFVTFCINLDDGIGDYTSQVYFIDKLNKMLQGIPNANLQNISIISDLKLKVSKFVRENKILEESVTILDNQSDSLDFRSCQHIIGTPKNALQKEKLHELIQEANFLFNLALPLVQVNDKLYPGYQYHFKPCEEFEIEMPDKEVFIESWRAYQFKELPNKETAIIYPSEPAFSESVMGMHEDQKGLRFIEPIPADKIQKSMNKKFIDEMGIQDNDSFETYAQKNSFAIGYLQDKSASIGFINLVCQMSPKNGDMNALINLDFFKQIENQTAFIENIRALGFTQIHLPDLEQRINLNNGDKRDRILRLFDFKGISDTDKNQFYSLAEMISASGDNSLSDLISAGVASDATVPFIQPFLTSKDSCLLSLYYEISKLQERTQEEHEELINYILFLYFNVRIESLADRNSIRFEYNVEKIDEFKINRQKIADSWHKFCCFIYKNRNEKDSFNELIVRYSFHHLLKNDCIDECLQIVNMLPIDALKNISPLHLAVKLNKIEFVKKLIELESSHSDKFIIDRGYALEIARHYRHTELAGLLIKHWPNRKLELGKWIFSIRGLISLLRDLPEQYHYEIACEFKTLIDSEQLCEQVLMEIPKENRWDFIRDRNIFFCKSPAIFKLVLENDSSLEFLLQFLDEAIKIKEGSLTIQILKEIPLELRFNLVPKMQDFIAPHIDAFLQLLPADCHLKLINETLGKESPNNSAQLAKLIRYFPMDTRFDYCCKWMAIIDNQYHGYNGGDYGCALILAELPTECRFEFALKIKEKIQKIFQLDSILALLPERERLQFSLGFADKIQDFEDFHRLFEVFPEHCRLELALELIDKIQVLSKFCHIIEQLPKNHYTDYLRDTSSSKEEKAQAFIDVIYIHALFSLLRRVRKILPLPGDADRHSKAIVDVFLSMHAYVLQIAPNFISEQAFENAQYLRQVAKLCAPLREKLPAIVNNHECRLAISNAAKYSELGLKIILKLFNYFAANEALTEENVTFICLNPLDVIFFLKDNGLEITSDLMKESNRKASDLLAKRGLFSKINSPGEPNQAKLLSSESTLLA